MTPIDLIECRVRTGQPEVAMHAVSLLHRVLRRSCEEIHPVNYWGCVLRAQAQSPIGSFSNHYKNLGPNYTELGQ